MTNQLIMQIKVHPTQHLYSTLLTLHFITTKHKILIKSIIRVPNRPRYQFTKLLVVLFPTYYPAFPIVHLILLYKYI